MNIFFCFLFFAGTQSTEKKIDSQPLSVVHPFADAVSPRNFNYDPTNKDFLTDSETSSLPPESPFMLPDQIPPIIDTNAADIFNTNQQQPEQEPQIQNFGTNITASTMANPLSPQTNMVSHQVSVCTDFFTPEKSTKTQ